MLELPLDYPVYCEAGCLGRLREIVGRHAPSHSVVIIADASVWRVYGAVVAAQWGANGSGGDVESGARESLGGGIDGCIGISPDGASRKDLLVLKVPPGEKEKSRERWAQLSDAMMTWGAGRDTSVVALGGGVTGDLAGFVAATYMRGVPVVQVPTTLLAMVDASVGGKTAVDTPAGKNLVGAFHNPAAVVVDPAVLHSLPLDVFRSGLAEMIKHGVIADGKYLDRLAAELPLLAENPDEATLPALIADSIRIKASVVAHDPLESGRRAILNFGHTVAHAIEKLRNYEILHGEAVAIGMVVEAVLAERLGIARPGLSTRIRETLNLAALPSVLPPELDPEAVVRETHSDKKNRSGTVRYALPQDIGRMESAVAVNDAIVTDMLRDLQQG